ncbi:MAG TPA: hypothetical protein DEA08_23070 [Planctomycetes bacterium]|nr:hypothetical protein [Planctomycetota bacterium]
MNRAGFALAALLTWVATARAQDPPPAEERVFVLAVGIEDYADPEVSDLAYAEDDAQAIADFFAKDPRSPTQASRVKLLRGKQATRRAVLRAIRDHLIRQAVGPKDVALLFFAGHGFSDANGVYLATVDTELADLEYTSIRQETLQKEWAKIAAGRRVLLLDACKSGGLKGLRGFSGLGKRVLPSLPQAEGASVVVAATQANQLSREDRRTGHGVFTACLLKGLRGAADASGDGSVSLGELAAHLQAEVPRLARAAGGNQTPAIRFGGDADLGRGLILSEGKARPLDTGSSQLARVAAEREAAEKERQRAELRMQLAEARLKKSQGATAAERARAEAEAKAARASLAKAKAAEARVREEERKRIEAERRAAKAEAENAELRRQLAELKGEKEAAEQARQKAEAARRRERELAKRSGGSDEAEATPKGPVGVDLSQVRKGQVYVFESVTKLGGNTTRSVFHFEITDVLEGKLEYRLVVKAGDQLMPQSKQLWPVESQFPSVVPREAKTSRETIEVIGRRWDCKVIETEANGVKSRSWSPERKGVPTWPLFVKSVTEGNQVKTVTVLTAIKQP